MPRNPKQLVAQRDFKAKIKHPPKPTQTIPAGGSAYSLHILRSLAPEPIEVIQEIPVVVRRIGDEGDNFVATFHEANVNASGDTPEESVANLREILAANFQHFLSLPGSKLGPEPRRQLEVLKTFLRKN